MCIRDSVSTCHPPPDRCFAATRAAPTEVPLMSTFDATRSEETIFTWGAPPLKFGPGAADEIGFDLAQYGVQRALVLTDQGVGQSGVAHRIADALTRYLSLIHI